MEKIIIYVIISYLAYWFWAGYEKETIQNEKTELYVVLFSFIAPLVLPLMLSYELGLIYKKRSHN